MDEYRKRVIFTDERKVIIDGKQLVYMYEGKPPCIAQSTLRRLDLMIWGSISYNGVDTLCDVDGNTNFQKYIKIIVYNAAILFLRIHLTRDCRNLQEHSANIGCLFLDTYCLLKIKMSLLQIGK